LDAGIKIDEVPDGSADGSHPNASYHPLEDNHLFRLNPFPRILIQCHGQDAQTDQND
jgi:hypothetical protein